jgi:hypothetical protein
MNAGPQLVEVAKEGGQESCQVFNLTEIPQLTSGCSALPTRKMRGFCQALWSSDVRERCER